MIARGIVYPYRASGRRTEIVSETGSGCRCQNIVIDVIVDRVVARDLEFCRTRSGDSNWDFQP